VGLALALHLGRLGAEQPGLVHQVHLGDGGAPRALVREEEPDLARAWMMMW